MGDMSIENARARIRWRRARRFSGVEARVENGSAYGTVGSIPHRPHVSVSPEFPRRLGGSRWQSRRRWRNSNWG